jgi:hypothetical protein
MNPEIPNFLPRLKSSQGMACLWMSIMRITIIIPVRAISSVLRETAREILQEADSHEIYRKLR